MTLSVITRDEAEADIAEAALWYERRAVGLGAEFVRSVDACFAIISRQPDIFPVVYRQTRMALLRRFPYLVIYRVFPDFVSVVAVVHGRRHPRHWKTRVAE
ncbi:MAG TPA: type II toxin-antitoxin system RelE/ParE family toxin [Candidatus Udaeobacter sp.]|nr:type II toxin-antitoxin system RelE/ParE family toxin [Candidatus Udaeobacter sp.]